MPFDCHCAAFLPCGMILNVSMRQVIHDCQYITTLWGEYIDKEFLQLKCHVILLSGLRILPAQRTPIASTLPQSNESDAPRSSPHTQWNLPARRGLRLQP